MRLGHPADRLPARRGAIIRLTYMNKVINCQCCVAGGGPAGMMLGFLLARMGVDALVLEKHGDFLRDFRGDTIHASTLELMYELGILDEFLRKPHQELREIAGQVGSETVVIGDFTHLPTHCKFVGLMPQWDFLDFVKEQASRYETFHLKMQAEVFDLIIKDDTVQGALAKTAGGVLEVRAALTVGADGRHSVVRQRANLKTINIGAPMDVMWMRLSRHPDDGGQTFGHADKGKILVLINRENYWQCAFVIPKGEAENVKKRGLESFRQEIVELEPLLADRVSELRDWKDVSLLTVAIDRLQEWFRPGLLCIGDAAHAMSPIGGVGINLAIQDAVATANILGQTLRSGAPSLNQLRVVQRRRTFPTRATQWMQVVIQNNAIRKVLSDQQPLKLPLVLRMLRRWPVLRRIPARLVGVGFRPEHIRTPEMSPVKKELTKATSGLIL
jgi:2-polyprenyl-6-methoxyphenol hydroxylase-like FAD-dependent oxidoreductase